MTSLQDLKKLYTVDRWLSKRLQYDLQRLLRGQLSAGHGEVWKKLQKAGLVDRNRQLTQLGQIAARYLNDRQEKKKRGQKRKKVSP